MFIAAAQSLLGDFAAEAAPGRTLAGIPTILLLVSLETYDL